MKKVLTLGSIIILTAILSWSCHLEDFNLKKLAVANDIKPIVYAPLAYGTYKVGDRLTSPMTDTDTIKVTEIDLNPISYDKTAVSFSSTAIDSAYLVVNFTNGTPMKMQFQFDFFDQSTSTVNGQIFDSGIMESGMMDATGKVTQSVTTRREFPMDSNDLDNITMSDGMQFKVKLFQPDKGPVTGKNLKESLFTVQISVRAPVSLWKLN
jgi:hypothetical protein